jgi:hypothetical protein
MLLFNEDKDTRKHENIISVFFRNIIVYFLDLRLFDGMF